METGDLQPLQNLDQLTELNLICCEKLIGQSISGFEWKQPARDIIGRFLGTLAPLANFSQLKKLWLNETHFTGQSFSEFCVATPSMKHSFSFLLRDWGHRAHDLSNDLFLAIISNPWTDIGCYSVNLPEKY